MIGASGRNTSNTSKRRFLLLGRRMQNIIGGDDDQSCSNCLARFRLYVPARQGWRCPCLLILMQHTKSQEQKISSLGTEKVEGNSYPDVQQNTPPAATQNAPRPAAVQRNAPLGS